MRYLVALAALMLLSGTSAFAAKKSSETFDWDSWQHLPVQAGGRQKPLDTLAREALLESCDGYGFADPRTGRKLPPVGLYMAMIFDWQGWGSVSTPGVALRYFEPHRPDDCDNTPLIRIDSVELREALGIDPDQRYFSPLEIINSDVNDPETGKRTPFGVWSQSLPRDRKQRTFLQDDGWALASKLWVYQELRMGQRLEFLPVEDSEHEDWISINALMRQKLDDQSDPGGVLRKLREDFLKARAAYLSDSAEEFNEASAAFIAAAKELGPKLGLYPQQSRVDLEVTYNRVKPFRLAWIFLLVTFCGAALSMAWQGKPVFYIGALVSSVAGLVAMLIGFGMREGITGWAPLTNMYESVVFMALGTIIFGLIFELISRKRFVILASAAVAAVALLLADFCPTILNPSLRPLMPVLRSNFWLRIHVGSIMLSYATFGLALGLGNITLWFYLVGSKQRELLRSLSKNIYELLRAGVLLLAIGTILGAFWADYSWGRFWGWDPKEVWALITLSFYLALLHARYVGWVRNRSMAAWSVVCFAVLVIMAWYGVNYVLNIGMHSYGMGGGGQYWVFGAVSLQLLYVIIATAVSAARDSKLPASS